MFKSKSHNKVETGKLRDLPPGKLGMLLRNYGTSHISRSNFEYSDIVNIRLLSIIH